MHESSKLYSIGEVSEISGVSIKALRYYHKENILVPAYINQQTGYRYYTINQLVYIDIIKTCRQLGLSIKELKEVFESSKTEDLLSYLNKTRKKAESQITQLTMNLEKLASFESTIHHSLQIMKDDEFTILEFPKRFFLKLPISASEELLDYSSLEKLAKTYAIEEIYKRGILYEADYTGTLKPSSVLLFVKEKDYKVNCDAFSILPAGNYVTISYEKKNENEKMLLLKRYLADNHLYIEHGIELELFYDIFNTSSYACQMQLYVKESKMI